MKTLRIPYTWADRRPALLDRFLYIPPHYDKHSEWEPIPWSDPRLFGNDQPIAVEYCSGNGQWICERAKLNPEMNWVAVEKRFDRSKKIWARLQRESIPNLFVVCAEGVIFTRHYATHRSASQIFINFPDPWPKLRHAKHRIIRQEFLDLLKNFLVIHGKIVIVTDDANYLSQIIALMGNNLCWKSLFPPPYFTTEWPDFGNSYFYDLWSQKHRTIYYQHYELCH